MKLGWMKYAVVAVMTFSSGTALMYVSHRVQNVQREILRMERSYAQEQETIRLLQAEWSFLNNPERLESLATQYLDLNAPPPEQLISHVDSARPLIIEEDVTAAAPEAKIYEAAYAPTAVETVVSAHKPAMKKTQAGAP